MIGTVDSPELAGKLILGGWALNKSLSDVGFSILERDRYTCQRCGFNSRPSKKINHGFMVPVDTNSSILIAREVKFGTCLCQLCASALAVNWSVLKQTSDEDSAPGCLIWLPEFTQDKISIVASLILATSNNVSPSHHLYEAASHALTAFNGRTAHMAANVHLYKNDKDEEFVRALSLLPSEFHEYRAQALNGVRFWPNPKYWAKSSHYWLKAVYENAAGFE